MLGQATAVLVCLSTLFAVKLDTVALLAVLCQRLTVTSTSDASLLDPVLAFLSRHLVGVIVDRAALFFRLTRHAKLVGRQTRGRRGKAAGDGGSGNRRLGNGTGTATTIDGHGERGHLVSGLGQGSRHSGHIGAGIGYALASVDAVGSVQSTR